VGVLSEREQWELVVAGGVGVPGLDGGVVLVELGHFLAGLVEGGEGVLSVVLGGEEVFCEGVDLLVADVEWLGGAGDVEDEGVVDVDVGAEELGGLL